MSTYSDDNEKDNSPSTTSVVLSILTGGPIAGAEDRDDGEKSTDDYSYYDEDDASSEGEAWSCDSNAIECIKKGEAPTNTIKACDSPDNFHSSHAVVEKWSNDATIHGIHYVLNRQRLLCWRRRLWGMLLLFSTSLMIWQIGVLVQDYYKWETNTNVKMVSPKSMDFPEITICNLNTFQNTRVADTGIFGDPVNEEELIAISQPLEEFIQAATYNRKVIQNLSDFFYPVVTVNGLCFQFQTDENITRPGLEGGLSVSLYINADNYYNGSGLNEGFAGRAAYGVGVQVFVAQKGTTKVSQVPFDLALPGTLQFMSIKRQIVNREKGSPWKTCFAEAPQFTQPKCREECFAYLVRQVCGCREYGDNSDLSMPFCPEIEECYRRIDGTPREDDCDDAIDCTKPPCFEEVYSTRSSAMSLGLSDDGFIDVEQFATILINYESIRQEHVTEVRANTFSQLLGNIGGQMGLFMGISVISVIEIFGELLPLRLLPRLWGDNRLYGMGSKER